MTDTVRRSKRLASKEDELKITSNKKVKQEAQKNTTKVEVKPLKETTRKTEKPSVTIVKKSKSRAAKKEDAIDLEKEEEVEEKSSKKSKELEVGDTLPKDLELEIQDSTKINLLKYAKDANILVIFAYPKASTPGCTRQAKGFRDEYEELNGELSAKVLGLSADSAKAQTTFKTRYELPYDLLCDVDRKLISLLGIKKQPKGIIRSHFIFVDGVLKVKKVKVSPEDSYQGALKQIKELK